MNKGASSSDDRATHEPSQGLGHSVSVPSAVHGLGMGKSDEWMTPPGIFDLLDCHFDLDVAAPEHGPMFVPCDDWISADSLLRQWRGFVWMNPPFGGRNALEPWVLKFFEHGSGIALTPDRTSSPWFRMAWARADAVLFLRKTPFHLPCGSLAGSPSFGTTLWASGERAKEILLRASCKGGDLFCIPKIHAQGMEAGTAETTGSAEGDSPVRKDAPQ